MAMETPLKLADLTNRRTLSPKKLIVASLLSGGADAGADRTSGSSKLSALREESQKYGSLMVGCLKTKGFDAEAMSDGGVHAQVPAEQQDAYSTALDECEQELGYNSNPPPPDDDVLAALYKTLVSVSECLKKAGYDVSEPPSEKSFIDSAGGSWSPYTDLDKSGQDAGAGQATCPGP